ncbi:MAG: hypothetical protein ACD_75C00795G0003 [uncultured bacterium]|nr:MAG: hypothetical protein ACD_75C00795G0003 [uncultured bacterium]
MHRHAPSDTNYPSRFLLYAVLSLCLFPPEVFAATVHYGYDQRQRLIGAEYDNGVTFTYSYDKPGNRLTENVTGATNTAYEDAEDGNISGWDIYDNDPAGSAIVNLYDDQRTSRVIEFTGAGTANGYRLRKVDGSNWNDTTFKVLEWSARYGESFTVYIAVQTKNGFRYLYYTPVAADGLGTGTYIHHGLGSAVKDGQWHTFVRDLAYDLKAAQPDNQLEAVLGFLIRGSGRVDDIKTLAGIPAGLDSDGDALTDIDEINTYGTNPYSADTDGDGIDDGEELAYWGAHWNSDADGDGVINILDPDADGDGFGDGMEIRQGTNPGDSALYPAGALYDDAEDGDVVGWDIYDNDPTGATINNVYDDGRSGRVIEFGGAGTANGYRLRNDDGSYWADGNFKVLQWSMRYAENFVVYIAVQTKNGFRYLYYTPVETDGLGTATYIHHGLGAYLKDGDWHTLVRDLAYDLKEAQPDNELQAVLGFLIRGSGRVDDIATLAAIPAGQDSDGDGLSNLLDPDADNDGFSDGMEIRQGTDPANGASLPTSAVYEDGEDNTITGWDIYDNDPTGATVVNVYDDQRAGRVIEVTGSGSANGYRLRNDDGSYWYDTNFKVLEWSMKYSESFTVYIAVQTKNGFRYLYYTPTAASTLGTGTYVHHGLGSAVRDGSWHTLARNLAADLKEAQPDNELESVLGFLLRGSGRVDDIKTKR